MGCVFLTLHVPSAHTEQTYCLAVARGEQGLFYGGWICTVFPELYVYECKNCLAVVQGERILCVMMAGGHALREYIRRGQGHLQDVEGMTYAVRSLTSILHCCMKDGNMFTFASACVYASLVFAAALTYV